MCVNINKQEANENSRSDKFEACAHFVNQIHTKQLLRQRTFMFLWATLNVGKQGWSQRAHIKRSPLY